MTKEETEAPDNNEDRPKRYVSVDALRGFDMFWILGADSLARSLPLSSGQLAIGVSHEDTASLSTLDRAIHTVAEQLEHVPWDGFHFYDLIFPLFVFLMGVSTVFSLDRIVKEKGKTAAYWRVIRRAAILYLLGLFYHGGIPTPELGDPEQFRLMGVLHRIAICYLFGGILYLNFRWKGLISISAALLIGYWALMTFVPIPGYSPGNWVEGTNLANYLDTQFLPGHKWDGNWDPEGLLSTMPAVVSGLLGLLAGMLMRNRELSDVSRLMILLAAGVGCIAIGYGWHEAPTLNCPIIKKLWTPSFVLYAGGWSFILLAVFHLIIDIGKFDIWARPFVWIGMNPITLYMLNNMFGGFRSLVLRMVHDRWIEQWQPWSQLAIGIITLLIPFWIAWIMYRNKFFIRV